MELPLVLSIDIGTSSLRVLAFDGQGRLLPDVGTQIAYEPTVTADGGAELDADWLLDQTLQATRQTLAKLGDHTRHIASVAVCTLWHSVLGVDENSNAVTPFLLWADTRCVHETDELKRRLDERSYHARTGCFLHTNFLPAKLVWFCRNFPDVAKRVRRWMSFGEYLHLRLLSTTACSVSMASGTGLFNQQTTDWDDETLQVIGITKDQLSPLTDFAPLDIRRISPLVPEALHKVAWFPALGDGACSNIGSGAVTPDKAALMVGTTSVMRVVTTDSNVKPPFGLWHYRADAKRHLIGGAQSNGGIVFQWLTENLRLPDDWEEQLAQMQPTEHGLTVLPFLLGERSPEWDATVPSAIVGLRLHHSPVHLLRAFMEAIALRMALVHDLLTQAVSQVQHIIATGGALVRSRVWAQMFADAIGQPLTISPEPETSARGAALMALEALGVLRDLTEAPMQLGETIEPNTENRASYRAALERQKHLYDIAQGWVR